MFPVVKQMLAVQVPLARKRSYAYSEILDDLIKTDGGQSEISGVKASDGQDRDASDGQDRDASDGQDKDGLAR